jgi:hypothetical protein
MSEWNTEPKVTKPPKRQATKVDEVAALRKRASAAAAMAKTTVPIAGRISVDLYKAMVELAEEFHVPIIQVIRQCLTDGVRKYKDLPPEFTPFQGPARVARAVHANPSLLSRVRSNQIQEEDVTEEEVATLQFEKIVAESGFPLAALTPSKVMPAPEDTPSGE